MFARRSLRQDISEVGLAAITDRLALYLESARTALANEAFGQADACLVEATNLIPLLPVQGDVCFVSLLGCCFA